MTSLLQDAMVTLNMLQAMWKDILK
jgi:hypothetical protein